MRKPLLAEVKEYWKGKYIPLQWYSCRDSNTIVWFNELRYYHYGNLYYEYLVKDAEFQYRTNEKVLEIGIGVGTDLAEYALNGSKVT